MNEDERITLIEQGINSPFWIEYLSPLLAAKATNATRALLSGKSEADDVYRGKFQAYQDIFDTPQAEIETYKRDAALRQANETDESRAHIRAVEGFGSPLEPGALSEDESDSAATAQENN